MVDDSQKKSRTGKRPDKTVSHERDKIGSLNLDTEEDAIRTSETYVCTGNFLLDFRRLCVRSQMIEIPEVKQRPHRPISPPPPPVVEEKAKPGKGGKDKNQPALPEPELELSVVNENGEPPEAPPKTYSTKDKFEYFHPCVFVETDHVDKQDLVTEVFIRGWKTDAMMMSILTQCWTALSKLTTISLWNTGLDSETVQMLGAATCQYPSLRTMILDCNPVKSEAWHLLITGNSTLQNLSLRYCNITDVGAEGLGRALGTTDKQNQKLLTLNLTGNKITDIGAEHLARGLRMNRTLLCLGLGSNLIEDVGAITLAEVISRFPLTHDEIVARRKLLLSNTDRKIVTPLISNRKGDGHDRPGSVRSQLSSQAGVSKGKAAKSGKKSDVKAGKDDDSKHEKSKAGKPKDAEKVAKKTSSTADVSKVSSNKKSEARKKRTQVTVEPEVPDAVENQNPLLENVEHIGNGVLLLQGNFSLISLNVSNNKIGEKGIHAFLKALQYQTTLFQFQVPKAKTDETVTSGKSTKDKPPTPILSSNRFSGMGLLRLVLQRNQCPTDCEDLKIIETLMSTKDPLLKVHDSSTDQK